MRTYILVFFSFFLFGFVLSLQAFLQSTQVPVTLCVCVFTEQTVCVYGFLIIALRF